MQRMPEPELMDDPRQARAYAEADFEAPHGAFIEHLQARFADLEGEALDLGCGPGDITLRFARAFPGCRVHGIDGAEVMLALARESVERAGLGARVRFSRAVLPDPGLPRQRYAVVISNSLLHHLHRPQVFWDTVRHCARPGAAVFVMDLARPPSPEHARALVETYARTEPEVLKHDFYRSLLAAFEPEEVRAQLQRAGLDSLRLESVSDRHWIAWGRLGP